MTRRLGTTAILAVLAGALAALVLLAGGTAPPARGAEALLERLLVPGGGTPLETATQLRQGATYRLVVTGFVFFHYGPPTVPSARTEAHDALYCWSVTGYLYPGELCLEGGPIPGGFTTSALSVGGAAGPLRNLNALAGRTLPYVPNVQDPTHRYEVSFVAATSGALLIRPNTFTGATSASGQFTVQLFGEPPSAPPGPGPGPPAPPAAAPTVPPASARAGDLLSTAPDLRFRRFGLTLPLAAPRPGFSATVQAPPLGDEQALTMLVRVPPRSQLGREIRFTMALAAGISEDTLRAYCLDEGLQLAADPLVLVNSGGRFSRISGTNALLLSYAACLAAVENAIQNLAPPPNVPLALNAQHAALSAQAAPCRVQQSKLSIRRQSPRRLRVTVLGARARAPRPRARVTCARRRDGTLAVTVASTSAGTPLRRVVGRRPRIGLARTPGGSPGGTLDVRFERGRGGR